MAAPKKRDALAELQKLRPAKPAAANDAVAPVATQPAELSGNSGQVMPSQTMRRDLLDVCAWHEKGMGWTEAETAELRAEYQRELQRQPFDVVADVLAQSGALARESMRKFDERVAADCAARRKA